MASVRALRQAVEDQKAKVATDKDTVKADADKLAADQATLATDDSNLATSQQTLLDKLPEGVAYNLGDIILVKLDGAIREIPTGDIDADLDTPRLP